MQGAITRTLHPVPDGGGCHLGRRSLDRNAHLQHAPRACQEDLEELGLSIAFCGFFLLTWIAQAFAEWGVYAQETRAHGEQPAVSDYLVQFGQSTLENWQSEFLQLFSFVVFSAVLIHKGSAESKDSDEEMQASLKRIEKRLEELDPQRASVKS